MSINLRQEPFFGQNFAFSTNYLNYEIPDFRGAINAAIPVLVYQGAVLACNPQGAISPMAASALFAFLDKSHQDGEKLLCADAVEFHRVAMSMAGDSAESATDPSGVKFIDDFIDSLLPGKTYLCLGSTGSCKTTMAIQLAVTYSLKLWSIQAEKQRQKNFGIRRPGEGSPKIRCLKNEKKYKLNPEAERKDSV